MDIETAPVAFRQFVLKMHSRCDLACDHCYVYEHADTSWQRRPMVVSEDVLERTADRIAEHARAHGLETVHVVLHGGEPLLAGRTRLRAAAVALNRALDGVCTLDLRIHTNGVTLNESLLDLFHQFDIHVGISLDGDKTANDLHRRYADGRSSYARVIRAVELLNQPRHRRLFAGLLCTIDVRNDPAAVYDALAALHPPRVDFLLPHATWDEPPLRPEGSETPYADWLMRVHSRWDGEGRPFPVRFFDSVHSTLAGGGSLTESLGLAPADLLVVETDGTLEQADSLKTAYDGAPATGYDVFRHSLDEAAEHPGLISRQLGLAGLARECRACPVVRSCGGGLYAHRYRTEADGTAGFDHPSVYCQDLFSVIHRIKEGIGMNGADADGLLLPEAVLDELATGHGGAAAVTALRDAQLEVNRQLLDRLVDRVPELDVSDAWQLTTRLDREAPGALDQALLHPYLRPWAVRVLRAAEGGRTDEAASDALAGVAELAAGAAVSAGIDATLEVPLRDQGVLRLPGLGLLRLGGEAAPTATVTVDKQGFTVESGPVWHRVERPAPGPAPTDAEGRWEPRPQWTLAASGDALPWTVALEDRDPERALDCWQAAEPGDARDTAGWGEALQAAWELVCRELPGYAEGLRQGLTAVTPLRPSPDGRAVSAAARDAFGVVGAALPPAPEQLALLLVHEFQHVKLGAVFDLHDLFDRQDPRRYRAPWRPDLRPFEGLFQGAYAHIAVVEFWRARHRSLSDEGRTEQAEHAWEQFTTWLGHTHEAILVMAGSGTLTPSGERFVAAMRATVEPWVREAGSRSAADAVARRSGG